MLAVFSYYLDIKIGHPTGCPIFMDIISYVENRNGLMIKNRGPHEMEISRGDKRSRGSNTFSSLKNKPDLFCKSGFFKLYSNIN